MCTARSLVPDSFFCGSVKSVLKKGNPNSCKSYMSITVVSLLSKLFEHILLSYDSNLAIYDCNEFSCWEKPRGKKYAHRALVHI